MRLAEFDETLVRGVMKELRGMPAAKAILADLQERVDRLSEKGIVPKLTVVRVGAREDDLSYERGIYKRFEGVGAKVETIELPLTVTQEELEDVIVTLNQDKDVHGVLMFRPLPKTLDETRIKSLLAEEKEPHPPHQQHAGAGRRRDFRHQAPRGHRRDHAPQPHPPLHHGHLVRLAGPGHPHHAQPAAPQPAPRLLRLG